MNEIPDPLVFATRALASLGAIVEAHDDATDALLPAALATRLGVAEELRVKTAPADEREALACGIGSPLLERLGTEARRAVPWTVLVPDVEAPKVSHATALATRFVVRNGLTEVTDAAVGDALYAQVTVAWSVEADDRYEGLLALDLGPDGGEPGALGRLLDAAFLTADTIDERARVHVSATEAAALLAPITARGARVLERVTAGALASIERRHLRDHARMTAYFAGLITEITATRRKVDPAVTASRTAAMVGERDARLRDLTVRYTPRIATTPVALVFARLPVVRVNVRVRRRKLDRTLRLYVTPGAHAFDALACDGCAFTTHRPAVCDERLHVLCEECAPHAQGRLSCRACEKG